MLSVTTNKYTGGISGIRCIPLYMNSMYWKHSPYNKKRLAEGLCFRKLLQAKFVVRSAVTESSENGVSLENNESTLESSSNGMGARNSGREEDLKEVVFRFGESASNGASTSASNSSNGSSPLAAAGSNPQRPLYSRPQIKTPTQPEEVLPGEAVDSRQALIAALYATARGLEVDGEKRAYIEELVVNLEAMNPTRTPTRAISALNGRWKLIYTTNNAVLAVLLALQNMPIIGTGEVYQIIDSRAMTAQNMIDIAVPIPMSLRADSNLEVWTPRQFRVAVTRVGLDTYVSTPQLLTALEVPNNLSFMGQSLNIDLSPIHAILEPVNAGIEAAQAMLQNLVSPGVQLTDVASTNNMWMLTTYLDDTVRVSRDDGGNIFVMVKDVAISTTR